jgi:hypothetical protein
MLKRFSLCAALLAAHAAALAEGQHAVAVKAGALGLGVEYAYRINDRLAFRAGLNGAEFGFDAEESGIDYDFDLVWDSLSVAVDFHPLQGPLRVTGGLLRNDNRLEAVSRPSGPVTVGGTTYTPEEVGTLVGRVAFNRTAPFVGLGWDWSRKNRRFGMSFDLGLLDQGTPRVSLSANGGLASDPAFADDIDAEERELAAEMADLDLVPYGTLGFVIRF